MFSSKFLFYLLAGMIFATTLRAELLRNGPFLVDTDNPEIIFLDGEIDAGAALNFRRAYDAAENPSVLSLNSPGGIVQIGLLIADDVHRFGLHTIIPEGSGCYSSCALIFLAGHERRVIGELGVHQVSNASSDLETAQLAISDILDVLNRFDTPVEVLTAMFRTPPNEMHVFSPSEIAAYGLNREGAGPVTPLPHEQPMASTAVSELPAVADDGAAASPRNDVTLGALERLSEEPVRLAVYAGLDFYGEDLSSLRAADIAECAARCVEASGQCKAFTFNANERLTRGPNCFLKSKQGQPDGNAVAVSGLLLSRIQTTPSRIEVGVIDPELGLFEDVDISGGDMSPRPLAGVTTAVSCRLACVRDDRCLAFTFVGERNQCWLKSGIGQPRQAPGMTSGLKEMKVFEPIDVISLQ